MRWKCRSSPLAASVACRIWSMASSRAMPAPCWPPRSSTSAPSPFPRPSNICASMAWRCGWTTQLRRDTASFPRKRESPFSRPTEISASAGMTQRVNAIVSKGRTMTLDDLEARIALRAAASPEDSYTAKLIARGMEKCAQKLGEEATEAVIAAVTGNRAELVKESADLLYHLLVVLKASGVPLGEVMAELDGRT